MKIEKPKVELIKNKEKLSSQHQDIFLHYNYTYRCGNALYDIIKKFVNSNEKIILHEKTSGSSDCGKMFITIPKSVSIDVFHVLKSIIYDIDKNPENLCVANFEKRLTAKITLPYHLNKNYTMALLGESKTTLCTETIPIIKTLLSNDDDELTFIKTKASESDKKYFKKVENKFVEGVVSGKLLIRNTMIRLGINNITPEEMAYLKSELVVTGSRASWVSLVSDENKKLLGEIYNPIVKFLKDN